MGNVFTTRFDADNHKEEILNKCREINTKDTETVSLDTSDFVTPNTTLGGTATNNGITYDIKDKLKLYLIRLRIWVILLLFLIKNIKIK